MACPQVKSQSSWVAPLVTALSARFTVWVSRVGLSLQNLHVRCSRRLGNNESPRSQLLLDESLSRKSVKGLDLLKFRRPFAMWMRLRARRPPSRLVRTCVSGLLEMTTSPTVVGARKTVRTVLSMLGWRISRRKPRSVRARTNWHARSDATFKRKGSANLRGALVIFPTHFDYSFSNPRHH